MALESAWHCQVPERAAWLRALMLERERVANHLGDIAKDHPALVTHWVREHRPDASAARTARSTSESAIST